MGLKNYLLMVLIVHLVGELVATDFVDPVLGFKLESPNYPKNSGSRTHKTWNLTGPPESRLQLNCSISLLKRGGCSEGFLSFWEDSRDRVNLCSVIPSYVRESHGNQMNVQFTTGFMGLGRFSCVVRAKLNNESTRSAEEDLDLLMPDYWKETQVGGAKPTSCPCGWTNKKRIVGGQETGVNEYAFMAYIKLTGGDKEFCGGSIITERHVLSSASCLSGVGKENLKVIVGGHDMNTDINNTVAQALAVEELFLHEDFIKEQRAKDIALLQLSTNISFNKFVGPVCLPTGPNFLQDWVTALGWGLLSVEGKLSNQSSLRNSGTLQYVNLRILDLMTCLNVHQEFPISSSKPTQLCTSAPSKDTCQGDAGGPLVYVDSELNRFVQVGLISSESVECPSVKPSVHTLIFPFFDWIQRRVENTEKGGWRYPLGNYGKKKDISPLYQTCEKIELRL